MVSIHTVAFENSPIPLTVYYQAMQTQQKSFVVLLENTTCYLPDNAREQKQNSCVLELIKKEILTAHDLNVVHKSFLLEITPCLAKKMLHVQNTDFPPENVNLSKTKTLKDLNPVSHYIS